ncbi:MAG: hypothetical protein P9X27_03315 [Candidatus Kaelpia aquatica]|nr:hypothetical protein [Candidatus Kaelpia aquatica]
MIKDCKSCLSKLNYLKTIRAEIILPLLLIASYLFITQLNALTPPVSRDALNYHLYLPKLYLEDGQIMTIAENIYSYFPAYWGLFYSFLISLSSDIMPKLMHSLFLIMSIFLIMDFVKILNREAKPIHGMIAGIIFLSAPTITKNAAWAYLDISFSFYLLLGIYMIIQSRQSRNRAYLYLAAISIGFATGMKYLGLIWIALSGLLIIEIDGSIYKSFKSCLRFALVATLIASPFYIRNYIQTGNPFFPFLSNIFGYQNIEAEKFELIMAYFKSYGEGIYFKDFLLLPYRLLFESEFGIPSKFDGKISLLFIASIAAIIKIRKTIPYKSLLYMPLIYLLLWFLLSQQIRFLIPLLAILSIITGFYLSLLKLKYLNYVLIFAGLLYLYYPLKDCYKIKPYNFILGRESKSEFMTHHIRAYPIIEYINNSLPQKAKIMLLEMGPIAYLLERELYQESIFEEYSFRKRLKSSRTSINLFFKENNIDFILIDEQFMKTYTAPLMEKKELYTLGEVYFKDLALQYRWNNFALYKINIENGT